MKRREFGSTLALAAAPAVAATPKKNALMHVGGDYHGVAGAGITSQENLEYNLRYGVKHLTAQVKNQSATSGWDLDELKRMRDNCDKAGVTLEAIRMEPDYITKPKGADRDREIEKIAGNIEKAAQCGVRVITFASSDSGRFSRTMIASTRSAATMPSPVVA